MFTQKQKTLFKTVFAMVAVTFMMAHADAEPSDYPTYYPTKVAVGKAIRYSLNHWTTLTNYLKDGRLKIDNNAAENVIRPFAVGRKNGLFSGSPRGAKAGAIFYSLIETCKANQVEPYNYFCTMLHRIRLCKTEDDYQKLLPQFIQL